MDSPSCLFCKFEIDGTNEVQHCSIYRYLQGNLISTIDSGTFASVSTLTYLYNADVCSMAIITAAVQGPFIQPNHHPCGWFVLRSLIAD